MNNQPPLVHPDLLVALGAVGYFPSLCAIQVVVETQDAAGGISRVGVDIPGKEAKPCRIAPARTGDNEIRRDAYTVEIATWDISLQVIDTDIIPKNRVVISGVTYDILAVRHDSVGRRTLLKTRIITV